MGFGLIIVPANDEAKNFALGSVGPMEVTLTDNLGTSFLFNGSSTGTVEAASGIEVASQQFNFLGELDPAATSLKLTIEGGEARWSVLLSLTASNSPLWRLLSKQPSLGYVKMTLPCDLVHSGRSWLLSADQWTD